MTAKQKCYRLLLQGETHRVNEKVLHNKDLEGIRTMARNFAHTNKHNNRKNVSRMISHFKGNLNNVELDYWAELEDGGELEPEERFAKSRPHFDDWDD